MTAEQAIARWVAGHHAFFVLLQGIVLAHRRLADALDRGDDAAARRALGQAARMLNGSAAAMLFAGDMPPEAYRAVRESMTPPNLPDKFSGLWSADHRAMMEDLKALRERIADLDGTLRDDLRAWQQAMDNTYTAHACVCEQFVGDGPSLAMMRDAGGASCTRSAIENIEAMRRRALDLVARGDLYDKEPARAENA